MRLAIRWRREIVCRHAVALVTDYLEGRLSAAQKARLERHLAGCDGCDEYLREMRLTIDLTGRIEPDDLAPGALDDLVELLMRYRAEETGGDAGGADGPAEGGIDR